MLIYLKSYKNAYVFKSMCKVKNLNNFLNWIIIKLCELQIERFPTV